MTTSRLLRLVALAVLVAGCGGARLGEPARGPQARSVAINGVALELPPGWDGYTRWLDPDRTAGEIWAASRAFVESPPRPDFPHETLAALPEDGIAVEIMVQPLQPGSASLPDLAQISLVNGYFLADGYEGQPAPNVSSQVIEARMANHALYVRVFFGRTRPDAAMRASANRVLGSLFPPRETPEDGFVRFDDPAVAISGRYPADWHWARALTSLLDPREVLTLATYPLRGGAEAGECAPDTARADMPPNGVFIWLLEYRPSRGEVWADLPRDRFPPKPDRFELQRSNFSGDNLWCFSGFGYTTTFRAADRPFQLLVAFGGRPADARLAEVEAILDSLEFGPLPPPPPDPYAGWPSVNDNPGDSLRPPPGWPATAAMFPLGTTPRPRPLFFASNRPLPGLPQKLVPYVHELRGPFPTRALAALPSDGVLLWVLEDEKGDASAEFPPIEGRWPTRADFREADAPAGAPRGLRWLRAGGSFRGYRFSLWIAAGSQASEADLELALKSGASLAVSGCWRDEGDDCPDS
ncbi:MAG TPA: hypothetical protein VE753_10375 [Gaiellaceae bacterium]|jgi:hypothetical protein|nr:hypothetical protein [Gaiellaceae bacterium]